MTGAPEPNESPGAIQKDNPLGKHLSDQIGLSESRLTQLVGQILTLRGIIELNPPDMQRVLLARRSL